MRIVIVSIALLFVTGCYHCVPQPVPCCVPPPIPRPYIQQQWQLPCTPQNGECPPGTFSRTVFRYVQKIRVDGTVECVQQRCVICDPTFYPEPPPPPTDDPGKGPSEPPTDDPKAGDATDPV